MKAIKRVFVFLISVLGFQFQVKATEEVISDYKVLSERCHDAKASKDRLVLRKFIRQGQAYVLYLDPENYVLKPQRASMMEGCQTATERDYNDLAPRLKQALDKYQNTGSQPVQANHGFKHFSPACVGDEKQDPIVLSIDMCTTKKQYSRELYERMASYACTQKNGEWEQKENVKPLRITVAISGKWIEYHEDSLTEIKSMVAKGCLQVTWANHSHAHPYTKGVPDKENFFVQSSIEEFKADMLRNEKLLVQNNIAPATFYRFPGLISTSDQVEAVLKMGVIPVGETAWLSKGHEARPGRIVLIHGNGVVPHDVDQAFEQILHEERPAFSLISMGEAAKCDDTQVSNRASVLVKEHSERDARASGQNQ